MKRYKVKVKENDCFCKGYYKGKKDTINKILKFVDEESEFIPDIITDKLLDRIVQLVKKI